MSEHTSRPDNNLLNARVKIDNGDEGHIRAIWTYGSTIMILVVLNNGGIVKRCAENVKFISN